MGLVALLASALSLAGAEPAEFTSSVAPVRWKDLRFSYRAGCPVPPRDLRLVRVSHWGFDRKARTGSLVVHRRVTADVVAVFRRLHAARFPIRRMVPVSAYRGDDDASMAADNTSGFNCRPAIGSAMGSWSMHAHGLAVDVNPVENPYVLAGRARPPAGRRYVDRSRVRPGMAVAAGILVRAFESVGWRWGGRWRSPDYQHFSTNGR